MSAGLGTAFLYGAMDGEIGLVLHLARMDVLLVVPFPFPVLTPTMGVRITWGEF